MNERTPEQTPERTNERTHNRTNVRTNEQTNNPTNEPANEQTIEQMIERTNERYNYKINKINKLINKLSILSRCLEEKKELVGASGSKDPDEGDMCRTNKRSTGFLPDVSPAGVVPDRAGDEKPSLRVSSGSRERIKSTPRGFEEHRPEILKDMSGDVDGRSN